MKSTKLRKLLLSTLLVLTALAVAMSGFAPVAAAKSLDLDQKVFTAVDTFVSDLPNNGYGYVDTDGLSAQLASANKPFVVDVRTPGEYAAGHIPGAVNIPLLTLLDNLNKLPAKNQPIVTYCGIGHNGAIAMMSLSMLGYTNVKSLGGGYLFWTQADLPTTVAPLAAAAGPAPTVDKEILATLKTFISKLPQNGYGYITATALNTQLNTADRPFVVDVRTAKEFTKGHILGAKNIPILTVLDNLNKLPAKDKPIVTYCGIGHNGAIVMTALSLLGYTNVKSLGGGYLFWTQAGLPVTR